MRIASSASSTVFISASWAVWNLSRASRSASFSSTLRWPISPALAPGREKAVPNKISRSNLDIRLPSNSLARFSICSRRFFPYVPIPRDSFNASWSAIAFCWSYASGFAAACAVSISFMYLLSGVSLARRSATRLSVLVFNAPTPCWVTGAAAGAAAGAAGAAGAAATGRGAAAGRGAGGGGGAGAAGDALAIPIGSRPPCNRVEMPLLFAVFAAAARISSCDKVFLRAEPTSCGVV